MMKLRAAVLAALVVMLGASPGMAADPGGRFKVIPIDFLPNDTADLVMGDASGVSTINDTTLYDSKTFGYEGPFTNLVVKFIKTTDDTTTATGLFADSVAFLLQTRCSHDSATWHTVATTTLATMASWTDMTATKGINLVVSDSVASLGEDFRIRAVHIAEEDSLVSHVTLKSNAIVDVLDVFQAHAMFRLR